MAYGMRSLGLAVIVVMMTSGGCAGTGAGQDTQLPTAVSPVPVQDGTTGSSEEPSLSSGPADISLMVDGDQYSTDGVVTVTVMNMGEDPVFTDDQKSDCSIVTLQWAKGSDWKSLLACGSERAPRVVRLAAGERQSVRIDLKSEHFRPQPVQPGTYRVMFSYRRAEAPQGSEPERVTSGAFTVS